MSGDIGLETLKFQLLQGFRTGNIILDTMIAGLVISCSGYIFERLRLLFNIPMDLSGLVDSVLRRKTHEIIIRGRKTQTGQQDTKNEFSQRFMAVLHQVKKLDFKEADIEKIEEVESSGACFSLVRQRHPFKFTPDVFGSMEVEANENNSEEPVRTEKYTVRVFSTTKGLNELDKLVAQWEKEYSNHMSASPRNSITITGRKLANHHTVEFSEEFHAVLHQISKLKCHESDVKHLSEVFFDLEPSRDDEKKESGLVVHQEAPFKFTEDIFGLLTVKKDSERDKSEMPSETYTIVIYSDVVTVDQLTALLHTWVNQWEERVNSGDGLIYFTFDGFSKEPESHYRMRGMSKPHAFKECTLEKCI